MHPLYLKTQLTLARVPWLYKRLMRCKPGWNREKYVFASLLKPGDVVIDGGANMGVYIQFFSFWIG